MKSIKLTEEHKSKLLEMCKVLFIGNEYNLVRILQNNHVKLYDDAKTYDNKTPNDVQLIYSFKYKTSVSIHWFEFCCKKLAFQIYNFNIGKTKTTYSTFVAECIIISTFHPIDYLYEEFKKLKTV